VSAPSAARPLDGRRGLVTGSSRNLGAEIARSLARRGATVVITYHRSRSEAEGVVDDLRRATGLPHAAVPADLSHPDAAGPMVEAAADALGGPVEILVNNHGPFSMTPFAEIPADEYAAVMDGNLTLALRAVQQVVPGMRAGRWGRIVNLSAGSTFLRNHSVYGLAKNAVGVLTESLALELGPEITVNAVAPGQIAESAADIGDIDPTFVERAVAHTPAGRLVSRHEVAEIVASLCAPPFDLLNGVVLPVDGGWRLNRF
jgi:NAD(P)-dependent dehydrogenase (short-subunit alcohol dehydrogenase family)